MLAWTTQPFKEAEMAHIIRDHAVDSHEMDRGNTGGARIQLARDVSCP
jgi:hypothetical protein